jgi:hypothetical protein
VGSGLSCHLFFDQAEYLLRLLRLALGNYSAVVLPNVTGCAYRNYAHVSFFQWEVVYPGKFAMSQKDLKNSTQNSNY